MHGNCNRFTSQSEQETEPQGSASKSTRSKSESPLAVDASSFTLGTLNTIKIVSLNAEKRRAYPRRNIKGECFGVNGDIYRLWGLTFVLPTLFIVWLLLVQTSKVDAAVNAATANAALLARRSSIMVNSVTSDGNGTKSDNTQQLFRKAPELTGVTVTVTADHREIGLVRRRNRNLRMLRHRQAQKHIRQLDEPPLDDENDDSGETHTAKTLVNSSKPPLNSTDVIQTNVQTNHLAAGQGIPSLNATVTASTTVSAAAVQIAVPSVSSLTTASPVTPIPAAAKKVVTTVTATLAPRAAPIVTATPRSSPTATTTLRPTTEKPDDDTPDTATAKNEDDLYDFNRPRPDGPSSNMTARVSSWPVLAMLLGLAAMIFTAWQMSDNPDGVFASLCRLIITCLSLVYRVVTSPCRKCLPCCFSPHHHHVGNGYHEPYGHMRVSTMDYGYKDPTLELS
jgi:hypothetical protein